ncbi:MAG: hypothetical protein ACSHW1_17925 [Yoonia sp.]|uniref:hypothetical protein n=1 Tax=Yoonia sp. TaxID=2212373 RepID=UPI003EF1004E
MSDKTWGDHISSAKDALWVIGLVSPVLGFVLFVLGAGLVALYGDDAVEWAQEKLGIAQNYQLALEALGENRVIRQEPGLSYVSEPVVRDDSHIQLNVTLARTTFGRSCTYTGGQAMFVGRDGIPRPSDRLPPIQQAADGPITFELIVKKPDRLPTGRAVSYLILNYTCHRDGKDIPVPDRTDNMPFIHARG